MAFRRRAHRGADLIDGAVGYLGLIEEYLGA